MKYTIRKDFDRKLVAGDFSDFMYEVMAKEDMTTKEYEAKHIATYSGPISFIELSWSDDDD